MKSFISLTLALCLCLQFLGVLSASVPAPATQVSNVQFDRSNPTNHDALVKECGALGVMAVPDGMDESAVRHCADPHAFGRDRGIETTKAARAGVEIFGRGTQACNSGPKYGCARETCWRECGGRGEWCWIAAGNGGGDWYKCTSAEQCHPNTGGSCAVGCLSCGCSC